MIGISYKFKRRLFVVLSIFVCLAGLSACESKVQESSPTAVPSANEHMQQRLDANAKLNQKLSILEESAIKVSNILALYRRLSNNPNGTFTPIDFLLNLGEQVKQGLPNGTLHHFYKTGEFQLPFTDLSPQCQRVIGRFSIVPKAENAPISLSTQSKLEIETCFSKKFVNVLDIYSNNIETALVLHPNAFKKLFSGLIVKEVSDVPVDCYLQQAANGVVSEVTCQNLPLRLDPSDVASLDFDYLLSGPVRLTASAQIYNTLGSKTGSLTLKLLADGHLDINSQTQGSRGNQKTN